MTIQEFIDEYNWMCGQSEPQDEDTVKELYSTVSEMFHHNCGSIPNFELTNGGRTIILIKEENK